jgi:hypothetical protein
MGLARRAPGSRQVSHFCLLCHEMAAVIGVPTRIWSLPRHRSARVARAFRDCAAVAGGRRRPRRPTFTELTVSNVAIWGPFPAGRGLATSKGATRAREAVQSAPHLWQFIDNIKELRQSFDCCRRAAGKPSSKRPKAIVSRLIRRKWSPGTKRNDLALSKGMFDNPCLARERGLVSAVC